MASVSYQIGQIGVDMRELENHAISHAKALELG